MVRILNNKKKASKAHLEALFLRVITDMIDHTLYQCK